jgi:hypothetical protein
VIRSPRSAEEIEKVAIAAAFHDLGIWTDHTFDYLAPSVRLASAWLADSDQAAWTSEVAEMILNHHKVTRYRGRADWLVESLRRAGLGGRDVRALTLGVPRSFVAEVYAKWPDAGSHKRLVQLELSHLRKHPFQPAARVQVLTGSLQPHARVEQSVRHVDDEVRDQDQHRR